MLIKPVLADQDWLNGFFSEGIQQSQAYHIDNVTVQHKLDQNESPFDWPKPLKDKVLEVLKQENWNRYPASYSETLQKLIAQYAGVPQESVITGPGSHHLLCCLISLFAGNRKSRFVIARPSFPLYEGHCKINDIPVTPWELNQDYQYDIRQLPELNEHSVLLFASPNNPVGNALSYKDLETILIQNPKTMVIADEAYYEFAETPYTSLLATYSNLIIVRTLSKAMGTAGVRVGYAMGPQNSIEALKKMVLPYLLNHFSIIATTELLKDPGSVNRMKENVAFINREKERLTLALVDSKTSESPKVVRSFANFLLLKWDQQDTCDKMYQYLIKNQILVRNISKGPGLSGCLRATLGTEKQNSFLLELLLSFKK